MPGLPVFGAIPRVDELSVPSRHLGLITAVEHGNAARAAVEAMIGQVVRHVDLAPITQIAACQVADAPWDPAAADPVGGDGDCGTRGGQGVQFRLRRTPPNSCAVPAQKSTGSTR